MCIYFENIDVFGGVYGVDDMLRRNLENGVRKISSYLRSPIALRAYGCSKLYAASLSLSLSVEVLIILVLFLSWLLAFLIYCISGLLDIAILTPCSHKIFQLSMVATAAVITPFSVSDNWDSGGATDDASTK